MNKDLKCILITNLCHTVRIRTTDDHIIQCFSAFYKHPALINEDSWHLTKHGNTKIMIDKDTMHLMKDMLCEWGFKAKSDIILTLKLTSTIADKEERIKQWNTLYEYSMKLRRAMASYFDKNKVVDSTINQMKNMSISDSSQEQKDSVCDDHTHEKIPAKTV